MPIYKTNGKKDGKEKFIVRINYVADSGEPKQLTRVAYGSTVAKNLETKLTNDIKLKGEKPMRKMTVQELFNEFIEVKAYELRQSSTERIKQMYNKQIAPMFNGYRIDKITVRDIQNWKLSIEKKGLALNTKQKAFTYFKAMIGYAVKMDYLQKNPLVIAGNFKGTLSIKPEMVIYTPEEFKRFIAVAREIAEERERLQNDLSEWNYYVFFSIAFYTGLRKGEIYALKWSDINGSHLAVTRSIRQRLKGVDIETAPKNRTSIRTLQMPAPLLAVLNAQKER